MIGVCESLRVGVKKGLTIFRHQVLLNQQHRCPFLDLDPSWMVLSRLMLEAPVQAEDLEAAT
jgi:hypothetical protein